MTAVRRHAAPRTLLRCVLPLALAALVASCATVPKPEDAAAVAARAQQAVASPLRTEQDRKTDATRKPLEFLPFTQVAPGMMVLDVAAGGGYTSQLLVLGVGSSGKVWAQRPEAGAALTKRLADQPQANFIPVYRPFDDPVPPDAPQLDLVTLVLNYHDISYLPVDREKMNARIFAALKPGGRYVIVDHAAVVGSGITAGRTLHRIDETTVIAEARKAGFVLDAEGSFLRNPADPRTATTNNSPIPTDKFALRFVKP